MEQSKHRTFKRSDGVIGVGYLVTYAGVLQASIAWPDRQAQRFIVGDFERNGIKELLEPWDSATSVQAVKDADGEVTELTEPESLVEVVEPLVVDGERLLEAGDKLQLDSEGGATVLPTEEADKPDASSDVSPSIGLVSEAQALRNYLADNGTGGSNKSIIAAMKAKGIVVTTQQVSHARAEFKAAAGKTE